MTKEKKQEFTLRISQANKTQMIVILYEMVIVYIKDAKAANEHGDRQEFRGNIRKARGCIHELMNSLNFENELSRTLLQLYVYVNRELTSADIRNSQEPLEHCVVVISGLHEAYLKLVTYDSSSAVMDNTQTVYAGLTYGKEELNENLYDQGSHRGFWA